MRDLRLLPRFTGKVLAALAIMVAFAAAPVMAQKTIYVDTGGNDAWTGTSATNQGGGVGPVRTITHALSLAADDDVISIEAGTYATEPGTITVDKNVIFEARLTNSFDVVHINHDVEIDGNVVVRANSEGFDDAVFSLNGAPALVLVDGSLDIQDAVDGGRVQIPNGSTVARVDGSVSGDLAYLGDAIVWYVGSEDVTAGVELPADLGDTGELGVDFSADATLTLTEVVDFGASLIIDDGSAGKVTVAGDFVSTVDGATVFIDPDGTLDGSLSVQEDATIIVHGAITGTLLLNAGVVTLNGSGNHGDVDIDAGTVDFTAATFTANSVNIANNAGIAVDLNGNTLTVNGDFIRNGGSFTGGATLVFAGDDADATFTPGPNFSAASVSVSKDGETLTVTNDLTVTAAGGADAFTVAANTTVDLGGNTITVNADGVVTVDGSFQSLPTGGIVFAANDAEIAGSGIYGNIFVVLPNVADNVDVTDDVVFAGILSLDQGGIDGTGSISPTGENAKVIVSTASTDNAIDADFNTGATPGTYDIEYTGPTQAGYTAGSEFDTDNIRNVVFSNTGANSVQLPATAGTISGNFTLEEDADVTLDNTVDLAVEGVLSIAADAVLQGGAAVTFSLTGDGTSHSIVGSITDTELVLDAANITVTGSADEDHASTVADVLVAEDASATIVDIQHILGDLETELGSSLSIALAEEQEIEGAVTINGAAFTLASDVLVDGPTVLGDDVDFEAGTFDFAGFTYTTDESFEGGEGVTYAAAGGALVMTGTGNLGTNGEAIPNVVIDVAAASVVTLTSDTEISESLTEKGLVDLDVDASVLTVGGAITSDGGAFVSSTGAGEVVINTATATLAADATIDAPVTIAEDATLTLASADKDPKTLEISDAVTLSGTVNLQDNNLVIGGILTNDSGAVAAGAGVLEIQDDIDVGDASLEIPNLLVSAAADLLGGKDVALTITSTLVTQAPFALDQDNQADLVLGDGVHLTTELADPLDEEPTFGSDISVTYDVGGAVTTGNELPDEGAVNNLTVATGTALTTDEDVTVSGTLTLAGSIDNTTNGDALELVDGATLRLEGDNGVVLANADITAGMYSIVYAWQSNETISDAEYVDGATVTQLTVAVGGANTLTLDKDRSVNDIVFTSGTFDMNGSAFTITGDATFDAGVLLNGGARAPLTFAGSEPQNVKLAGSYVVDEIDFTVDKSNNAIVTIDGPANTVVNFHQNQETIYLNDGVLETTNNVRIFLYQSDQTQGFEPADAVQQGQAGHIAGNVTKRLLAGDPFGAGRSARFEFPTGSPSGAYRPFAIQFRENVATQTDITVNHEDVSPEGTAGLPRESGDDVYIGSYPDFYWFVRSSTSLGQAQRFDVELTAAQLGVPFDNEDNLRIIRRFDGDATTNEWSVQGDAANYDNFLQVVPDGDDANEEPDTTVIARVTNSQGGIVPQGARYTLGLTVDFNAAPVFTQAFDETTAEVGQDWTYQFLAEDADGDELTFSLADGPDGATITEDGLFSWTPAETDKDSTYPIVVEVTDGRAVVSHSATVTVGDEGTAAPSDPELPAEFALKGNYPNPFNPSTTIRFDLPNTAEVALEVYDMLGRQVMALPAKTFQAGADQSFQVDASMLSSGVYMYRLVVNSAKDTMVKAGQMTLVK